MSKHKIWVVEMLRDDEDLERPRIWLPTVGVRLTREQGRQELAEWKYHNTGNFRLSVYRRDD